MQNKKIYAGRVIDLHLEQVKLPSGKICELEMVHHPGGVAIIAMNHKNEVCLLRQFRHAAGGWIWEFPAGKIEAKEDTQVTARRELQEEAGVVAQSWTYLGKTISSPGVFTEIVYLYLAQQLSETEQQPEEAEVFEVHWMKLERVYQMLRQGEIYDGKTLVGLLLLQQHIETDQAKTE